MKLGDCSLFELLWRNKIWNRLLTKKTFRKAGHLFDVQVHLCATGFRTASGKAVGEGLEFPSNFRPFVMIMNQTSRGLRGGSKGASRGLQGGFKGASGGFKGASR